MAAAGNAQTFPRHHGQDAWLGKPFHFVWRRYDTASRPRGKRFAGNFANALRAGLCAKGQARDLSFYVRCAPADGFMGLQAGTRGPF